MHFPDTPRSPRWSESSVYRRAFIVFVKANADHPPHYHGLNEHQCDPLPSGGLGC